MPATPYAAADRSGANNGPLRGLWLCCVVLSAISAAVLVTLKGDVARQKATSPKPGGMELPRVQDLSGHNDPSDFTAEELKHLQRRFGVHGPQPPIAQLFTEGVDQLQPLRNQTLVRLEALKPVIVRESLKKNINPMLIIAILFDEIQHSKPGEDLPFIVHSGLVKTHGAAQIGIGEFIHQGLLPANPNQDDISWARNELMDPAANIRLLAGKMRRLKQALGLPNTSMLQASRSYLDAKAIATLAYLHNGKLDYPARILRYMQDAELHQIVYGQHIRGQDLLI